MGKPAGPGEDHEPADPAAFERGEARGEFALTWRAHGLSYGIPGAVDASLADGSVLVANLSRGAVATARERFARFAVVTVTASPEVRLERILSRGREDLAAARARVARRVDPAESDLEIVNDGTVAEAGESLVRFLAGRLAPLSA